MYIHVTALTYIFPIFNGTPLFFSNFFFFEHFFYKTQPGAIFSSNGLVPQMSDVVDTALTEDDAAAGGRGRDGASPDRSRGRGGRDDSSTALIPRRDSSPSMVRLLLFFFVLFVLFVISF